VYAGRPDNFGGAMMVGPVIRVTDVIKARALPGVLPPYQGLSLNTEYVWLFDDSEAPQYDLFDVRHVIVPHGAAVPGFYQPFAQTTRYDVFRVPTRGMTHFIAADDRRAVNSQRRLIQGNLDWLRSDLPAARVHIRWDYPADSASRVPSAAAASSQRCVDIGQSFDAYVGPDSIAADVRCAEDGVLLFKTTWHPNWRVTVDGASVETFMVSPSFLAARVPANARQAVAVYRPTPGKHGLLLYGPVVLLAVLLLRDRLDRPAQVVATRLGVTAT
jgi:hypothetical protein